MSEASGAPDVPCPPMFATETMAELSARQGRIGDALAIYRHLVGAGGAPDDRLARWKARLAELESGPAPAPAEAPAARAPVRQAPAAAP
ncbi:MAG TPA: hypothetical protein VHO06_25850, partial [Polyangia bacterium]|nr:hypothetical protein [Polyangia bacterium]